MLIVSLLENMRWFEILPLDLSFLLRGDACFYLCFCLLKYSIIIHYVHENSFPRLKRVFSRHIKNMEIKLPIKLCETWICIFPGMLLWNNYKKGVTSISDILWNRSWFLNPYFSIIAIQEEWEAWLSEFPDVLRWMFFPQTYILSSDCNSWVNKKWAQDCRISPTLGHLPM